MTFSPLHFVPSIPKNVLFQQEKTKLRHQPRPRYISFNSLAPDARTNPPPSGTGGSFDSILAREDHVLAVRGGLPLCA
jgi:hypothetical protein